MYTIAICENNPNDSTSLLNILDDYEQESRINFTVKTFRDAESLIESIDSFGYRPDILLSGILLPGLSGIEAVRRLRERGFSGEVIFTTSSPDYALTAYELDAAQYLVKPVNSAHLNRTLDQIIGARKGTFVVKRGRALRKIMCRDILFCETQGKYQVIHMRDASIRVRTTARAMKKLVPPPLCNFTALGSTYLLNLCSIVELNDGRVVFDGGEELLLSRKRFRALVKAVKEYIKP